ncbi:hypothetical protein QFC19_004506 [Naganishia cerealis]|uniref:Uncharacterized protein n=1 Tax=Naganishia cerealis TaxID=610337 RepID=A0ACC2VV14_9TREE|nr:hypothetical protein QFC19_004506 [Naganishia cerealis]
MHLDGPQKGVAVSSIGLTESQVGTSGTITGESTAEPAKKRQKTGTALNVLKAPMRKAKAPAFKPTALATASLGEPSVNGTNTQDHNNGVKPPPPPPSERRPARRRSSAEAMLKRLNPSPSPTRALRTTRQLTEPHLPPIGLESSKAGRSTGVLKSSKTGSGSADADGLDGWGTSLQAELGNERGRWKDMIVQGDPTPVKSNGNQTESQLLDLLDFGEPEEPLASAPKPLTPPRPAAATLPSTLYQTPSRRSRRYTVAPNTGEPAAGGEASANESLIPLPIEDTPMIRRNQEMRERASRRRSSAGNRGTRMSENLGRGDINMLMRDPPCAESPSRQGVPHPAVPSEKWYKHIGSSFPEPVRVRHLLLWGLKKAALEGESAEQNVGAKESGKASRSKAKSKGKETAKRTPDGDEIVKAIMDTVTGQMARGEIDTNIFPLPRVQEFEQERPRYELPDELPSRIPQLHDWSALVHEVLEDDTELMQLDAEDIENKVG